MFGKSDLIDSLSRDLARARNKRDALASDVPTLTAKIAELESRLSAERDRREREHAVSEMERIKKRVSDQYLAFAPVISGIREATEMAAAIVPEGHAFNDLLPVIATELASSIDCLLGDLDRRIGLLRASPAAPELPQSLNGSPQLSQNSDRVLRLPEWLTYSHSEKTESVEDRCRTAAA